MKNHNRIQTAVDRVDAGLRRPGVGLEIEVRSAIGTGPTELAAFDDALRRTGIANFNLIRLSSVIPPNSAVIECDRSEPARPAGSWGDRLYVVIAEERSSVPDSTVAAGIGWVQEAETAKGLFVEHEGNCAETVSADIIASLDAMVANRSENFGPIAHQIIEGVTPAGSSSCALVVATFESQPWANPRYSPSLLN